MAVNGVFSGNALCPVDPSGGTALPSFILSVLERRCVAGRVVFAAHEIDPCISGYDEAAEAALLADVERRRLRDEASGMPARAHHSRLRRLFGGSSGLPWHLMGGSRCRR